MIGNMENLKILSVLHKKTNHYSTVDSRKTHSIIIRVCGSMQYHFSDKTITVSENEMLFLPKGSQYESHKVSKEDPVSTIIHLDGDFDGMTPACYSIKDFYDCDHLKYHFADLWNFGAQSQKYQCLSLLYALLAYVANQDALQYQDKTKFGLIEPAVTYLQKHIYDCDLKMDELYQLCGISHTYFNKIFSAKFGTSPKNYVINKRISYAKSMIDSGEFNTVKELAQFVGYSDSLYFGKVFKQHYGISPVSMNQ